MENPNLRATLLGTFGEDLDVANAARVSFRKKSETLNERDEKLIRYLANHRHFTTFTHCFARFHLRAPLAIARQLWKSNVGLTGGDNGYPGFNEESRRYVDDTPACFVPDEIRTRPEGGIKQGSGGRHRNSYHWTSRMIQQNNAALALYEEMIADGVAPEQARFVLPTAAVVEWWWTGSLAAWARVYALRIDSHAQQETQEIARQIGEQVREHFSVSWAALTEAA